MLRLIQSVRLPRKPLAVLPNAGYPTVINREIYYPDTPDYFAGQMQQIVAAGARLIGGCCGTTPEFIRAVADLLKRSDRRPADVRIAAGEPVSPDTPAERRVRAEATNPLLRQFAAGKTVIAVEYDSPETAADLSNYLENALSIEEAGADAITIADCPVARPRIDSSLTAIRLRHTLRTAVPVPHLTCRDRNLNATKALLLGLNAEEVLNLIIVTGDPIPRAERDEVKSVFNFNSINLAAFIMSLNEDTFAVPMTVAGAFNINALSFDAELRKTRRKIKAGMKILYTQPVLSEAAVERMAQLRESLPEEIKIMGGILPVVSHRNALYMQNELSGIVLDPDVIDRYEGLNREQGEALALDISVRVAERIRNTVSGFYLITPFNRVKLVNRILAEIKKL
jgi:homocysteine S-methyltransferase